MVRREENQIDKLRGLLHCLSDEQFHSGETLGHTLGLSRSGVWKLIQQCRHLDIAIQSVTNKGYRLKHPLVLLNKEKISDARFPLQAHLSDIEIFDTLTSTNDYLLDKAKTHPSGHWACLAEHQSKGKGRRGRTWISPYAKNLYLSVLWRFSMDPGELGGLSLVTALALIKTLEPYGVTDIGIKWPNDILWQFKKLAGILIEISAEAHTVSNTVIGIGININMPPSMDKYISQPWISLEHIAKHYIDRNALTASLLNQLIESFLRFEAQGLSAFTQDWQRYDLTKNRTLTLITPSSVLEGKGLGINEKGHLLVQLQNNQVKPFVCGEVSIQMEEMA